jgi:alkylation response protein AidB-like acyl-CoA dehydrogenase
MTDLKTFRTSTRSWLEKNCPQSIRTPQPDDEGVWGGRKATYKNPESEIWLDCMIKKGWTVPTWPIEYGGSGLSLEEDRVLSEELQRINARVPLSSFGIWMLGPVLLEYGNKAQKKEHLPKISRGEIRWCQGYSEPNNGSDLAGLQTRAVGQGDEYVVNGSKIWTSMANLADWIFCLVRTDPEAPKHEGISFLLFDMESEGVSVSPIRLISGASPFCQTFFDNVKVPKHNLVGEVNQGWTIAKRLLQHERNIVAGMGGASSIPRANNELQSLVKKYVGEYDGKISDPMMRDNVAAHRMNNRAFQLTLARAGEQARAGQADGNLSSMFKYYGTEQNKHRFDMMVDAMGTQGLGWEAVLYSEREISITRSWLRSKGNSIEGGTSEVQLNVIAKRVLGLPD